MSGNHLSTELVLGIVIHHSTLIHPAPQLVRSMNMGGRSFFLNDFQDEHFCIALLTASAMQCDATSDHEPNHLRSSGSLKKLVCGRWVGKNPLLLKGNKDENRVENEGCCGCSAVLPTGKAETPHAKLWDTVKCMHGTVSGTKSHKAIGDIEVPVENFRGCQLRAYV